MEESVVWVHQWLEVRSNCRDILGLEIRIMGDIDDVKGDDDDVKGVFINIAQGMRNDH